MAYGQYSVGGGSRKTKSDMLNTTFHAVDVATARKGGHNRLYVEGRNGAKYFSLHETIVATLSPEGDRLELADGGWPTPTTRSAWSDALKAFGLTGLHRWNGGDCTFPDKTERSVVYHVKAGEVTGRAAAPVSDPMIRASVDDDSFCVRYDGRELVSDAGVRHRATPFKVLTILYRIDKLARAMKGRFAMRGYALDFAGFYALGGYWISCGQSARTIMIGCHTFKTQDIRSETKRIEGLYPAAVKPAKRWVKLNPTDFGMAAHAAEEKRRLADYRAQHEARQFAAGLARVIEARS